jgi:anti-sigma-K factor RskA
MSEMIERVAREICIGLGDNPDREGERLIAYDDAARIAIAAMRDCSLAMLRAGYDEAVGSPNILTHIEDDCEPPMACYSGRIWQAMIDAALQSDPS